MLASISILFIVWTLFIVCQGFPLWVAIVTSVLSVISLAINLWVFWVGVKAINSNTSQPNTKN